MVSKMINKNIKNITMAAMFVALNCIATMIIKIPSPFKGYVNLGDCVVILSGLMMPPAYGFFSAGIGVALADVFSGYTIYAPATFIIKGLMALFVNLSFNYLKGKTKVMYAKIIVMFFAEIIMIAGYFLFESVLYGVVPSLINIPINGVQAIFAVISGYFISGIMDLKKY